MDQAPSARHDGPQASPEDEATGSVRRKRRVRNRAPDGRTTPELYAAIDLGTNNCRLMIASHRAGRFQIVDSYSRIVRLGEDLDRTGQLKPEAMERAMSALMQCAQRLKRREVTKVRAVATAACRRAANAGQFLETVRLRTGLRLEVISEETEARLAVAGCASLIEAGSSPVMVMDVGGGSTEISWIDMTKSVAAAGESQDILSTKKATASPSLGPVPRNTNIVSNQARIRPKAWLSIAKGVVNLAERHQLAGNTQTQIAFQQMTAEIENDLMEFADGSELRSWFCSEEGYIIGTSGAITSLAALYLGLSRYDRSQVDGLWMTRDACEEVIARLINMTEAERRAQPCIGRERADLVLAGAAILQATLNQWPCQRLRVADRGLREGLLMSLVKRKPRRRHRNGSGKRRPD